MMHKNYPSYVTLRYVTLIVCWTSLNCILFSPECLPWN